MPKLNLFVRKAVPEDLPEITAFDDFRRSNETAILNGSCYVAGVDSTIAAYALFARAFLGLPFVDVIFAHREKRHLGLGNLLLSHLEELCPEPRIWISTNLQNIPMQSLLSKRGYRMSGVIENLAPVPELFYYKQLR